MEALEGTKGRIKAPQRTPEGEQRIFEFNHRASQNFSQKSLSCIHKCIPNVHPKGGIKI